jgi:hypothetical protein
MGSVMLPCLAFILGMAVIPGLEEKLKDKSPIFIAVTIATIVFGISWITKGETLFPDGQHYAVAELELLKAKLTK